jgi:hypothetical protein
MTSVTQNSIKLKHTAAHLSLVITTNQQNIHRNHNPHHHVPIKNYNWSTSAWEHVHSTLNVTNQKTSVVLLRYICIQYGSTKETRHVFSQCHVPVISKSWIVINMNR